MRFLYISLFIILCVVIEIQSERTRGGLCNGCQEGYTRIKRAKYYNRPLRYYKRPPNPFPVRGYYTPSQGYDNNQPPQSFRPKVSKRPINDEPADGDINNLIKQLSKQDLDQIIDFANEKQRESPKYNQEFETPNFITDIPDFKVYDSRIVNKNQNALDIDNDENFSLDGPFVSDHEDYQSYSIDFSQPTENNFQNPNPPRYQDIEQSAFSANDNRNQIQQNAYNKEPMQNQQYYFPNTDQQSINNNFKNQNNIEPSAFPANVNRNQIQANAYFDTIAPMQNQQYSFPNPDQQSINNNFKYQNNIEPSAFPANVNRNQIQANAYLDTKAPMQNQQYSFPTNKQQSVNNNFNSSDGYIFTDSTMMQEEELPVPTNLREDDYEVSFSNNVPIVVKSDSESYKVEDFGALPLMNYHSKLDTVDSYRVPQYTVTSPSKYVAPPSSNYQAPPVEPAPPISAVQDQSDAHLKAIKIWTHRSKGTAYTLHNDGSLSLERPARPKPTYGHP